LWVNRNDPGLELKWLEATLREMELRNESAIILGHVPSGDKDCLYHWAIRYRAITDRFQQVIRFSVYGHVHSEMYGTARSFKNNKPIGVQYWTGSVSTFTETNPSFRVYEVDEETMVPVKVHTYIFNLTDPNP
jgi:sphingomyelin phosphodiesterase